MTWNGSGGSWRGSERSNAFLRLELRGGFDSRWKRYVSLMIASVNPMNTRMVVTGARTRVHASPNTVCRIFLGRISRNTSCTRG